jgi:hypothetical protein
MKKAIYTVLALSAVAIMFTSCKKNFKCVCSFNNTVMYQEDLQLQTRKNAESMCAKHDSTISGQPWSCTVY